VDQMPDGEQSEHGDHTRAVDGVTFSLERGLLVGGQLTGTVR
jgi:hypothetical protein